MTTKYSTGLRISQLIGPGIKGSLDGGRLRLFSGAVPETADAAETGTLLLELTESGDGTTGLTFEDAPTTAVLNKTASEVWSTAAALASGEASYWRFVADGDTAALSTTEPRLQGDAGAGGTSLFLIEPVFTMGVGWTLQFFRVVLPTD